MADDNLLVTTPVEPVMGEKIVQRRDYILGSMFIFCVLGICWVGFEALHTPKDWDTLQMVDKLMSHLETFAIMILTGHFALSVGRK